MIVGDRTALEPVPRLVPVESALGIYSLENGSMNLRR